MSQHLIFSNLDAPGLNTLEVYKQRGGYGDRLRRIARLWLKR